MQRRLASPHGPSNPSPDRSSHEDSTPGAGSFGPSSSKKLIAPDELHPRAKRLKRLLRRDYKNTCDKHLAIGGKALLGICAYMDHRFKLLDFLPVAGRDVVKRNAKKKLLEMTADMKQPTALALSIVS